MTWYLRQQIKQRMGLTMTTPRYTYSHIGKNWRVWDNEWSDGSGKAVSFHATRKQARNAVRLLNEEERARRIRDLAAIGSKP